MNKQKATVQTNERKKKARNWTKEEIELFARVIADPCADYINTLEKKALKKEANADVFESILADFQRELEDENFIYENERKNFLDKNEASLPYEPLELSVAALQFKYKKLKAKWTSITCDARGGSGLKEVAEGGWYTILNPVLSENRASLDTVASGPLDLPHRHNAEEERNAESSSSSLPDSHSEEEKDEGECQAKRKGKLGSSSNSTI